MTTLQGGWTLVGKATGNYNTNLGWDDTSRWISKSYFGDVTTLADADALGKAYDTVSFTDVLIVALSDTSKHLAWRMSSTITSMHQAISTASNNTLYVTSALSGSRSGLDYNGCTPGGEGTNVKYGFNMADDWVGPARIGWRADYVSNVNVGGGVGYKGAGGHNNSMSRHYHGFGQACTGGSDYTARVYKTHAFYVR
jgi:hypothetical protein